MEPEGSDAASGPVTRYMAVDDWAAHREQIIRLYRDENHTLKQTMDTIEGEHGLKGTSVLASHHIPIRAEEI